MAAALVFASCGNKTDNKENGADTVSFEQSQIEESMMNELDSLADEWSKMPHINGVLSNGKIKLSDDEIKAKPDYLMAPTAADDLTLLSQKYRALGILAVDQKIAELYKMDTDAYKSAIAKIATDVNDPAAKTIDNLNAEDIKAFYTAEKEANRINLFWEASAASTIETLYVISQNTDKFITAFDDNSASKITYEIALLKMNMDDLSKYDTNIKEIDELLAPLNKLNAINVEQLKKQLAEMKPEIEAARKGLLK